MSTDTSATVHPLQLSPALQLNLNSSLTLQIEGSPALISDIDCHFRFHVLLFSRLVLVLHLI